MRSSSLLSGMVLQDESSASDLNLISGFPLSHAEVTVLKACGFVLNSWADALLEWLEVSFVADVWSLCYSMSLPKADL